MKRKLNILIACEESQACCRAFRAMGHNAYSCDLFKCSGTIFGTEIELRESGFPSTVRLQVLLSNSTVPQLSPILNKYFPVLAMGAKPMCFFVISKAKPLYMGKRANDAMERA